MLAKGTYDPYVQDKVKMTTDPKEKSKAFQILHIVLWKVWEGH